MPRKNDNSEPSVIYQEDKVDDAVVDFQKKTGSRLKEENSNLVESVVEAGWVGVDFVKGDTVWSGVEELHSGVVEELHAVVVEGLKQNIC